MPVEPREQRLALPLPAHLHERLCRLAERQERTVEEQALYLIERALGNQGSAVRTDGSG